MSQNVVAQSTAPQAPKQSLRQLPLAKESTSRAAGDLDGRFHSVQGNPDVLEASVGFRHIELLHPEDRLEIQLNGSFDHLVNKELIVKIGTVGSFLHTADNYYTIERQGVLSETGNLSISMPEETAIPAAVLMVQVPSNPDAAKTSTVHIGSIKVLGLKSTSRQISSAEGSILEDDGQFKPLTNNPREQIAQVLFRSPQIFSAGDQIEIQLAGHFARLIKQGWIVEMSASKVLADLAPIGELVKISRSGLLVLTLSQGTTARELAVMVSVPSSVATKDVSKLRIKSVRLRSVQKPKADQKSASFEKAFASDGTSLPQTPRQELRQIPLAKKSSATGNVDGQFHAFREDLNSPVFEALVHFRRTELLIAGDRLQIQLKGPFKHLIGKDLRVSLTTAGEDVINIVDLKATVSENGILRSDAVEETIQIGNLSVFVPSNLFDPQTGEMGIKSVKVLSRQTIRAEQKNGTSANAPPQKADSPLVYLQMNLNITQINPSSIQYNASLNLTQSKSFENMKDVRLTIKSADPIPDDGEIEGTIHRLSSTPSGARTIGPAPFLLKKVSGQWQLVSDPNNVIQKIEDLKNGVSIRLMTEKIKSKSRAGYPLVDLGVKIDGLSNSGGFAPVTIPTVDLIAFRESQAGLSGVLPSRIASAEYHLLPAGLFRGLHWTPRIQPRFMPAAADQTHNKKLNSAA